MRLIFRTQPIKQVDLNYDEYWEDKRGKGLGMLSIWQKERADLTLKILQEDTEAVVIADIGCGDGSILKYISVHRPIKSMIGVDVSAPALKLAEAAGIRTIQSNLGDPKDIPQLSHPDYVIMYEFLEHIQHSEVFAQNMLKQAKKGILFSVPNSGFFPHRFRLLFGHFFLQWRLFPGEHLRYWTLPDMKWWISNLSLKGAVIYSYEGIPLLNKIWPSMFAAGMLVFVPKVGEITKRP